MKLIKLLFYFSFVIFHLNIKAMQERPRVIISPTLTGIPKELRELIVKQRITPPAYDKEIAEKLLEMFSGNIQNLSEDEQNKIMASLQAHKDSTEDLIKTIKILSSVNKQFNELVNSPSMTEHMISELAKSKPGNLLLNAALELGTAGAKKWTKEYLKNPEGQIVAVDLLIGRIINSMGSPVLSADNKLDSQLIPLLKIGFKPRTKSANGLTLLFMVSNAGFYRTAKTLLDAGADVNAATEGALLGFTPLHAAASSGNIALIKLLLKAGANKNAVNAAGQTPFDLINPQAQDLEKLQDLLRVQ